MSRHKRLPKLSNSNRQLFLEQATRFHGELIRLQGDLRPTCEQYQAISKLHGAINEAVANITGEKAPWEQMPGPRKMC